MNNQKALAKQKLRRRRRVRKPIRGTLEQPRLSVFRSHKHIYCQVIDDSQGKVLAAASTRDKDLRDSVAYGGNRSAASTIGKLIAERAKAAGIEKVCFDRGHYKYHGRVADLANAAREGGLVF